MSSSSTPDRRCFRVVPTLSRLEMMASTRSSVMLVPRLKDLREARRTHHTSVHLVWSTRAEVGGLKNMCSSRQF